MAKETIYVLTWLYPLAMLGALSLVLFSRKKRPTYALMFVGLLLSFIGLLRYQFFHDPHGSFLWNVTAFPLLLVSGIWSMARAVARPQRRHS